MKVQLHESSTWHKATKIGQWYLIEGNQYHRGVLVHESQIKATR